MRGLRRSSRGFTLLEVLIALAIVAMSVGALLGTVTSSASNVIYLKEKTLAEWVALNRLTEIRIDPNMPGEGRRMGSSVMGGMRWEWEEEVTELPIKGMFRIDVRAHNTGETVDDTRPANKPTSQTQTQAQTPTTSSGEEADRIAWASTVTGVVGVSRSALQQPIGEPLSGNLANAPGGQPGGSPGGQPGQSGQPGQPGQTPPPPKNPGAPSE
jgi:general secretion pathway protein I